MFRTILFALGAASIGYVLYLFFYWRQMHALVPFLNGNLDAPHILLIDLIIGLILSLF